MRTQPTGVNFPSPAERQLGFCSAPQLGFFSAPHLNFRLACATCLAWWRLGRLMHLLKPPQALSLLDVSLAIQSPVVVNKV